ncbi:hypothetical protein [Devosia sp.]|uniref:hypothetical protein n=1 Tax=Devosia sp. TaxID=1871048 RepID=UPI002FCC929A
MLVNAAAIQQEMLALRGRDPWQLECMRLCTVAVNLFVAAAGVTIVARGNNGQAQSELVSQQVLGIRVLNSLGSADELILQGFFQPAGIMIRDIVECSFLLDLFSRAPEHLPKWIALGQEAGLKEYRPRQVRDLLNKIDGIGENARQKPYTFYSRYGTHPNPEAVGLIAPGGEVHIGPFLDETRLIGLTYDLTRFSVLSAEHLCRWIIAVDLIEDAAYGRLADACMAIEAAFMTLNDHLLKVPRERLGQ